MDVLCRLENHEDPSNLEFLKKQNQVNLALLDVTNEEPGKILGKIVNLHRTRSAALIDEMDFIEGTTPRPKTRIVALKVYLPVGSEVTPDDISPSNRNR
jgi:hypothetical protein